MAMMASQTIFNLYNQSQISELTIDVTNSPLFIAATSSDKGPEEMTLISGNDFFKTYVNNKKTMFYKHGQPLLQISRGIESGARFLIKRVTAPDSTLANIIISAVIEKVPDTPGENVGDPSTPPADGSPKVTIKYSTHTVENASNLSDIITYASALYTSTETSKTLPLFVIYDNGKGKSCKKIRISPDYTSSKELSFMKYNAQVIENTSSIENMDFAMNDDLQYSGKNYGLEAVIKNNSKQIKAKVFSEYVNEMVDFMSSILNTTSDALYKTDFLFGASRSGIPNTEIQFNEDSVNINNILGISLESGSNGSFGEQPLESTDYEQQLTNFFDGTFTKEIYDLDRFQIDACFDANYPKDTKKAIEVLCNWRKDFFFFRDLGIVKTYDQIKAAAADAYKSIYIAIYHNSYNIEDPYSKKHDNVTIMYSLIQLFTNHFKNGKCRPFEGLQYGITIDEAIENTINYIPIRLPDADQKQALVDIRVNYISYYGNKLVLESEMTSDQKHTQLSYLNNVIAIQEVVKRLRVKCPKSRYVFIDGDGNGNATAFKDYKDDIEAELNSLRGNFKTIEFDYTYDETYAQNKRFFASLFYTFKDFVDSEQFNMFAINASSEVA